MKSVLLLPSVLLVLSCSPKKAEVALKQEPQPATPAVTTQPLVIPDQNAAVNNDRSYALWQQGNAAYDKGKNEEAISLYKQAIVLRPNFAQAYTNLGTTYMSLNRTDDAIAAFKESIKLRPEFYDPYYQLGIAYKGAGNKQAAIEAFRNAVLKKKDFVEGYEQLTNLLLEQKQYAEAVVPLEEYGKLQPTNAEIFFKLGSALGSLHQLDKAISAFQKAIEIKRDYPEAHYRLGIAYAIGGQNDKAMEQVLILKTENSPLADRLKSNIR